MRCAACVFVWQFGCWNVDSHLISYSVVGSGWRDRLRANEWYQTLSALVRSKNVIYRELASHTTSRHAVASVHFEHSTFLSSIISLHHPKSGNYSIVSLFKLNKLFREQTFVALIHRVYLEKAVYSCGERVTLRPLQLKNASVSYTANDLNWKIACNWYVEC